MAPKGLRIIRVKVSDKEVSIQYQKTNGRGGWDSFTLKSPELPRPELKDRVKALAVDVVDLCELPANYHGRVGVTAVAFGYEGALRGATISANMQLMHASELLRLTTPYKMNDVKAGKHKDESLLLSIECDYRLQELIEECVKFIDGHRAQEDLPFKSDEGGTGAAIQGSGQTVVGAEVQKNAEQDIDDILRRKREREGGPSEAPGEPQEPAEKPAPDPVSNAEIEDLDAPSETAPETAGSETNCDKTAPEPEKSKTKTRRFEAKPENLKQKAAGSAEFKTTKGARITVTSAAEISAEAKAALAQLGETLGGE